MSNTDPTMREGLQDKYRQLQAELARQSEYLDKIVKIFEQVESEMPDHPLAVELRQEIDEHRAFHDEISKRLGIFAMFINDDLFDE